MLAGREDLNRPTTMGKKPDTSGGSEQEKKDSGGRKAKATRL